MKNKTFDVLVIIFVMLTGTGFGLITGLFYSSKNYWWVAMIIGTISSYPLAKFYLMQLRKISARGHTKKVIWLLSTLIAALCGIISTTLIHVPMVLILYNPDESIIRQMDGFVSIVVGIGELIGLCAGLAVGGICSLIYVLSVRGRNSETL